MYSDLQTVDDLILVKFDIRQNSLPSKFALFLRKFSNKISSESLNFKRQVWLYCYAPCQINCRRL